MKMRSVYVLAAVFVFSWVFASTAFAQISGLEGLMQGVGQLAPLPSFGNTGSGGLFAEETLSATPRFPDPYTPYEVEVSAPSGTYDGAVIKWYIDGVEDLTVRNQRSHTLTAGAVGERTNIRVVLQKRDGGTKELELFVTPVQIDIILEANTTVPHFYKGRALPSPVSQARATAIITTGKSINRETLSYRWEINNEVQNVGSIRGLSSFNFTMPLGQKVDIGVSISDADSILGEKTVSITPAQPEILFYQENPLLGVLERALTGNVSLVGNQITVRGEPYYLNPFTGRDRYLIEWALGGQFVDNNGASEPNVITLQGDGTTSEGNVALRMADLSTLTTMTIGSFYLHFGF
jgi:hypothetical protein